MGICFLYKRGGGFSGGGAVAVKTLAGSIINITDGDGSRFKGLRIFGKTTQNGTPTPDAPVPMESVGDDSSVNVTVCGKNLFSAEWEHGGINPNDGIDYASGDTIRCEYIAVCPLTTYTLSRTISTSFINVRGYDADKNYIGSGDIVIELVSGSTAGNPMNAGRNSCVIKTKENVHYLRFGDASNDLTTKYQMEIGTVATEYEPYKEPQTLTLSTPNGLPGIPVASGGNYTDSTGQQWICDEVDFNRGVYVQRVGARTLNGAENWSTGTCITSGMSRYLILDDKTTDKNIVKRCSHFKSVFRSAYTAIEDGLYYGYEAFIFDFAISTDKAADLSSWKNWLNSNPVEIHWQLTEPIETALTTEQLAAYAALHTNYPNTTVFNDAGAWMEATYTPIGG